MRKAPEIDDDVMEAAREMARLKNQGIGRAVDINALASRVDSAHVEHDIAITWFREVAAVEG